jgi:hypothetical protein
MQLSPGNFDFADKKNSQTSVASGLFGQASASVWPLLLSFCWATEAWLRGYQASFAV